VHQITAGTFLVIHTAPAVLVLTISISPLVEYLLPVRTQAMVGIFLPVPTLNPKLQAALAAAVVAVGQEDPAGVVLVLVPAHHLVPDRKVGDGAGAVLAVVVVVVAVVGVEAEAGERDKK
jgi:hypothetical protein